MFAKQRSKGGKTMNCLRQSFRRAVCGLSAMALLTACGGGGGSLADTLGIGPSTSTPVTQYNLVSQPSASWSFDSVVGSTVTNTGFAGWDIQLNSASIAPGKVGNAAAFDDSLAQSYGVIETPVISGNTMTFADNRISIALWLKPTKVAPSSQYLLLGGSPSIGFKSIFLWIIDGKVRFEMQPVNGGFQRDPIIQSTSAVPPGVWTHIAVTYDGATAKVYFNGTVDSSNAISHGIPTPNNRIFIGGAAVSEGGPLTFPGQIDELQLKASTLNPEQVTALANLPP